MVSEDGNSSYAQTFTGAGCNGTSTIILASGNDLTCTIVNADISKELFGAGVGAVGFPGRIVPLIGLLKVPTPLALPTGPAPVVYNYTVWNVGGVEALTNVTLTDDKCAPVVMLSGDINKNGKLDPGEQWKYSCTTTLAKTTTNTAIATGQSDVSSANNLGFRQTAIATAVATVVVGAATPVPLINIVKVPNRLTPFPAGGGNVTYTYTVTNPGVVAMDNVIVTDDKCAPVSRVSGDANGNNLLDVGETWIYTCSRYVSASIQNVATAEGHANGFIALGYAFANVFVSAPGLPNTGFPPEGLLPAGIILIILAVLATALKKRSVKT